MTNITEIENRIIGYLAIQSTLNTRGVNKFLKLDPKCFTDNQNRLLFKVILELNKKFRSYNASQICDYFNQVAEKNKLNPVGISELVTYTGNAINCNIEADITTLITQKYLRDIAQNGDHYDSLMVLNQGLTKSLTEINTIDKTVNTRTLLEKALSGSTAIKSIPVGIPTLQTALGGFLAGNYYLFSAPTKFGKTHTMVNCAYHAIKAGYKVLVFALEMTAEQYANRIFARATGINIKHFKKGILNSTDEHKAKFAEVVSDLDLESKLEINDQDRNIDDIINYIKFMDSKPDLVIIDYAGLVRSNQSRDEATTQSELGDRILEVSQELDFACIMAVQYTKQDQKVSANEDRFRLGMVSEDNIEGRKTFANMSAGLIALFATKEELEEEKKIKENKQPYIRSKIHMKVILNRHEALTPWDIECSFDGSTSTITEISLI